MKKTAEFPVYTFVLWVIISIIYYTYSTFFQVPYWLSGHSIFFIIVAFEIALLTTRYEIIDDKLIIKKIFVKTNIDLHRIRKCEYRTNHIIKQILLTAPYKTIYIEYNKYDSIELNIGNQDFFDMIKTFQVEETVC